VVEATAEEADTMAEDSPEAVFPAGDFLAEAALLEAVAPADKGRIVVN